MEGKLIIETPVFEFNKLGGLFIWSLNKEEMNSQLEIFLPSHITPKIHANLDMKMTNDIIMDAFVNISEQMYRLKLKVNGPIEEKSEISIELMTPLHVMNTIFISGSLHFKSLSDLSADLVVEHPYGVDAFALKHILVDGKISSELKLDWSFNPVHYNHILVLETKDDIRNLKGGITFNSNTFEIEIENTSSSIKANIEATLPNLEIQSKTLYIEFSFVSSSEAIGIIKFITGGKTHSLFGKLGFNSGKINGNFEMESDLLDAPRKVNFIITTPEAIFTEFDLELTIETTIKHSLKVSFSKMDDLILNVVIESPLTSRLSFTLSANKSRVSLDIETPEGMAKLTANKEQYNISNEVISVVGDLELKTNIFIDIIYKLSFKTESKSNLKNIELTLFNGAESHKFKFNLLNNKNDGKFIIEVESRYLGIKSFIADVNYMLADKIGFDVVLMVSETKNIITAYIDMASRTFDGKVDLALFNSGLYEVKAALTGKDISDMQAVTSFSSKSFSLSAKVDMMIKSNDDILVNMYLKTPFSNYENLKFGAEYKYGDKAIYKLFADSPLNIVIEGEFGKKKDSFFSLVNIETPFEQFKKIKGVISLPFNGFSPKVFIHVNDEKFGLEVRCETIHYNTFLGFKIIRPRDIIALDSSFRVKAPHEGTLKLRGIGFPFLWHLKFDSSFVLPWSLLYNAL